MKLIVALLVLSLVLFGCNQTAENQTDTKDTDAADADSTSPSGAADTMPPAAGSKETQKDTSDDAPKTGVADKFKNFLTSKANLQWKIEYSILTKAEGQTFTSDMTQYMKGTKKLRTDFKTMGMTGRMYMVDDVYTSCNEQKGSWSCMKLDIPKDDSVAKAEEDMVNNEDDYDISADGTKQVAGVTADCFKITKKSGDRMVGRYCIKDNLPLYVVVEGTSEGHDYYSELTAKSYSKSVSDNDFIPPAKATDAGAAYGGSGSGSAGSGGIPCSACGYMQGSAKDDCLASCS